MCFALFDVTNMNSFFLSLNLSILAVSPSFDVMNAFLSKVK